MVSVVRLLASAEPRMRWVASISVWIESLLSRSDCLRVSILSVDLTAVSSSSFKVSCLIDKSAQSCGYHNTSDGNFFKFCLCVYNLNFQINLNNFIFP